MPTLTTPRRRHVFNNPPDPLFGVDYIPITIPADAYFTSAVSVHLGSLRGNVLSLGVPSVGAMGEQSIAVTWQLAPIPGSFVEYELRVDYEILETYFGRVLLFEHRDFDGQIIEITDSCTTLLQPPLNSHGDAQPNLNDLVSSIIVLRGKWVFYEDINFNKPYTRSHSDLIILECGMYPWMPGVGIKNDNMSSLRAIR